MKWGDYPDLSVWAQSNHKPVKVEEESRMVSQRDVVIEDRNGPQQSARKGGPQFYSCKELNSARTPSVSKELK